MCVFGWMGRYPTPPPWPGSNATPLERPHFFATLLIRREKNWWVLNAQGVEGPHFFFFAPWRALDGEG